MQIITPIPVKYRSLWLIAFAFPCLLVFPKDGFSQKFERNDNTVTYRGNKFELSAPMIDTIAVIDKIKNEELIKVCDPPYPIPVRMNNTRIYRTYDLSGQAGYDFSMQPAEIAGHKQLKAIIYSGLTRELNALPNGVYNLWVDKIVIDGKGKIVYYENDIADKADKKKLIPENIRKEIDAKTELLISSAPELKPGRMNGIPVIVYTAIFAGYTIEVKNHKARLLKE